MASAGCVLARWPPRDAHDPSAGDRGGEERHRVGQVGLDHPVPRTRSGRGTRASGWPGCRRRRRPHREASPPSSPHAAPTAPTRRCARSVSPSANAAPDSSSPETNCDDADASISTVPPATAPLPRTENGRPSPSMSTPSPRNASSSGAIGRARACSSPSNTTVSVPSAATGGTNRSTVPARPQSTRASGGRGDPAADRQLGVVAVDGDAEGAHRADHQVGVAAAQRAADGGRPLRGGQRREHERPVGLRLRAGHRHRGVHGARRRRCLPVCSRPPSCPVARFCHHGMYVWAIRGNHRSGAAGGEDPGDRRKHGGGQEGLQRARTTTSRRPPRSARWSNATASPTTSRRGGCG